jgi:hypothetical protein
LKEKAREIAIRHVEQWNIESAKWNSQLNLELPTVVLCEEPIAEGDYGWVFSYENEAFLVSGELRDKLAGNAPLLITKSTGSVFELGTADPVETYVSNFINFGDPHLWGGRLVRLLGFERATNRTAATKTIRTFTRCVLSEAYQKVSLCLEGGSPLIECSSPEEADALATELTQLGFVAMQLPNKNRHIPANSA